MFRYLCPAARSGVDKETPMTYFINPEGEVVCAPCAEEALGTPLTVFAGFLKGWQEAPHEPDECEVCGA